LIQLIQPRNGQIFFQKHVRNFLLEAVQEAIQKEGADPQRFFFQIFFVFNDTLFHVQNGNDEKDSGEKYYR